MMDRRQLFKEFGTAGVGLALGGEKALADHANARGQAGPLAHPHVDFCGIHMVKADPKLQVIVQHYCAAHAGDEHGEAMFQCVLCDSSDKNAKLLGVEYVITDNTYRQLADAEKRYWHPHTYEVLGGGLIAPG